MKLKYNPTLTDDENLRELLLSSNYPEEQMGNITIEKVGAPDEFGKSTLNLVFSGEAIEKFKEKEREHDFIRVAPLSLANRAKEHLLFWSAKPKDAKEDLEHLKKQFVTEEVFHERDTLEYLGNYNESNRMPLGTLNNLNVIASELSKCQYGKSAIKAVYTVGLAEFTNNEIYFINPFKVSNFLESGESLEVKLNELPMGLTQINHKELTIVKNANGVLSEATSYHRLNDADSFLGNLYLKEIKQLQTVYADELQTLSGDGVKGYLKGICSNIDENQFRVNGITEELPVKLAVLSFDKIAYLRGGKDGQDVKTKTNTYKQNTNTDTYVLRFTSKNIIDVTGNNATDLVKEVTMDFVNGFFVDSLVKPADEDISSDFIIDKDNVAQITITVKPDSLGDLKAFVKGDLTMTLRLPEQTPPVEIPQMLDGFDPLS